MRFLDVVYGFKCPRCRAYLPWSDTSRTGRWRRGWRRRLDHAVCQTCGAKAKLSDGFFAYMAKILFILMPVFAISAFFFAYLWSVLPLTGYYDEEQGRHDTTGLGVILVFLSVFLVLLACSRIFRVSLVDPQDTDSS